MKIHYKNDIPYLFLKDKCVQLVALGGHDKEETNYYFNGNFVIENDDLCSFNDIADTPLNELPEYCCFNVAFSNDQYDHLYNILISRVKDTVLLRGNVAYHPEEWEQDLNAKKLAELLSKKLVRPEYIELEGPWTEDGIIFFSFVKAVEASNTLRYEANDICRILGRAQQKLLSNFDILTGVTANLNIPEDYRHIFGQYLMYFGHFLSEMGIPSKTTVSVNEEGVLLNINPSNKDEAIQNIYLALSSYIALADGESVISPLSVQSSEIRYQQLMANVEHLKSQLKYANAVLEVKNDHIEFLRHTRDISQTKQVPTSDSSITEKWEPIEGIALTKYKGKFFEIDIPKLIRKLSGRL
jgi:hypothetical protein